MTYLLYGLAYSSRGSSGEWMPFLEPGGRSSDGVGSRKEISSDGGRVGSSLTCIRSAWSHMLGSGGRPSGWMLTATGRTKRPGDFRETGDRGDFGGDRREERFSGTSVVMGYITGFTLRRGSRGDASEAGSRSRWNGLNSFCSWA